MILGSKSLWESVILRFFRDLGSDLEVLLREIAFKGDLLREIAL